MKNFFKKLLEKFKCLKFWQKSLIIVVLVSVIVGPFLNDKEKAEKEKLKIEQQAKLEKEKQEVEEKKKQEEQKAKREAEKKAEEEEKKKKEREQKDKEEKEKTEKEKRELEEKQEQIEKEQNNSQNVSNQSVEIHANVKSKVYHLPGQTHYNRISKKNLVIFHSEKEAINAGYRRAGK